METLRVEILNPKAKRLLKSLEELNLITINKMETSNDEFRKLLLKLRSGNAPTLEEITNEVEIVRTKRHEEKTDQNNS